MKPRQQVSRAAIELIKRFEGCHARAARLEDGRWTIGFGHTKTARQGVEISESDAEALLIYDLMEVAGALNDWVFTPLTQNQFDALAAFVFNIGLENFRHSGVLRRLNEGALLQAACAMEMWRKVDFEGEGIVVDALVRRRSAEKTLFLTPTQGFLPAPSAILRPKVDSDITGHVPASKPVEIKPAMNGERLLAERVEEPAPPPRPAAHNGSGEPPYASQVAADAITARLQSMLDEEAEAPASAPAPAAVAAAAARAEPELDLPIPPAGAIASTWTTPTEPAFMSAGNGADAAAPADPSAAWEGAGIAERVQETEPRLFASEPMTFEDFGSRRVAHHEFDAYSELDQVPVEEVRGLGSLAVWIALGAVGLVVFAGGIFFGFLHARNSGVAGYVGWGLGIAGIACCATAVYFLLERLGGREEQ